MTIPNDFDLDYTAAAAPTMTITEMDALATRVFYSVDQASNSLDAAQLDYDVKVTENAMAKGNEAIRAELERMYEPPLKLAEEEGVRAATAGRRNLEAIIAQTNSPQPTLDADEEWRRASLVRETVREDTETLGLPKLLAQVQQAVRKGDRPALYHYARYIPIRLGPLAPNVGLRDPAEGALAKLVGDINEMLRDRSQDPVRKRAIDILDQVRALDRRAGARKQAAYLATKPFPFQKPTDVPWTGV